MEKLSLSKQLGIVRLYLGGLSYREIAAKAHVSQGSVANVITELRAGRILNVQEPVEQLDLLRELAIDLRRCRLTAGQAVTGLAVFSRLQELGVEPANIETWAAMCRNLVAQGANGKAFMEAALALEEVKRRTGLSAEALEEKVHRLEAEVARLEELRQKLDGCQQELEQLEKQRQGLANEVSRLEKCHEPLRRDITQKEKRSAELSNRVSDLEQRAHAADERLAAAHRELQVLAGLQLTVEDLTGFTQRLAMVAQRHGIEPRALRGRLLHELEELDAGMGLESLVELRQRDLSKTEQAIAKAQQERVALDSVLQQLRQQQASLHAAITEEEAHVRKEMKAIARIARDAVSKLQQDLADAIAQALAEVRRLTGEAFTVGQEMGHYNATLEANQWLQTLVGLVKGNGNTTAKEARAVGLTVLRGLKDWGEQNQSQVSLPYGLTMRLNSIIEDLERWKT
jgi:archaellum component FlaC